MALPVGFYGSLQWIGWLSLLDEVALNHWNTHNMNPYYSRFIDVYEENKQRCNEITKDRLNIQYRKNKENKWILFHIKKIISELGLTENELNCLFEKCTAKTEEEQITFLIDLKSLIEYKPDNDFFIKACMENLLYSYGFSIKAISQLTGIDEKKYSSCVK